MYDYVLLIDEAGFSITVFGRLPRTERGFRPAKRRQIRECEPVKQIHTFCFAAFPIERTPTHDPQCTHPATPVALFLRG